MDVIFAAFIKNKIYCSIDSLKEKLEPFIRTRVLTDFPYSSLYNEYSFVMTFIIKPKDQCTEICLIDIKNLTKQENVTRFLW